MPVPADGVGGSTNALTQAGGKDTRRKSSARPPHGKQREVAAHVTRQPAGTTDGGGAFGDTKHITTPIAPRNLRVVAKVASRVSQRRSLPGAISVPGEGTSAPCPLMGVRWGWLWNLPLGRTQTLE